MGPTNEALPVGDVLAADIGMQRSKGVVSSGVRDAP